MTHDQLISHYGNGAEAARALGVSRQAVNNWRVHGIPLGVQYQIELATNGRLKADAPPNRVASSRQQAAHGVHNGRKRQMA